VRRAAFGRAARARVEERFSVERMVDRYLALYGLGATDAREGSAGTRAVAPSS
jgi:glycosyltransferase involved in cell wall biosynthesis